MIDTEYLIDSENWLNSPIFTYIFILGVTYYICNSLYKSFAPKTEEELSKMVSDLIGPYSGKRGYEDGYRSALEVITKKEESPEKLAKEFPGVEDAWDRGWIACISTQGSRASMEFPS